MALNTQYHLRCQTCAFVVHDQYFIDKKNFQPGICPNDGGVVQVVQPFTNTWVPGASLMADPESHAFGHVVIEVAK